MWTGNDFGSFDRVLRTIFVLACVLSSIGVLSIIGLIVYLIVCLFT